MSAMIDNQTPYPNREVKKLVRYALEHRDLWDRDDLLVRVKLDKKLWGTYTGRAYINVWMHAAYLRDDYTGLDKVIELKTPPGIRHMIVCRIGTSEHYNKPRRHDRGLRGGPPGLEIASWQEALLGITAHEAEHIRQFVTKKVEYTKTGRRKKRFSEVECEWAEHKVLFSYRKEHG